MTNVAAVSQLQVIGKLETRLPPTAQDAPAVNCRALGKAP